jgi:hypothetical protein
MCWHGVVVVVSSAAEVQKIGDHSDAKVVPQLSLPYLIGELREQHHHECGTGRTSVSIYDSMGNVMDK